MQKVDFELHVESDELSVEVENGILWVGIPHRLKNLPFKCFFLASTEVIVRLGLPEFRSLTREEADDLQGGRG